MGMRYDDPNVPVSAVIGLVGTILVFVIIVVLQAVFHRVQDAELARKVYSRSDEALSSLRAEQLEALHSYGWIDQAGGVAHVPIDRAMDLVAEESALQQ